MSTVDSRGYGIPRRGRSKAGVDLTGPEAILLLIAAMLPIVLLSVVPLLRGIYLGFTNSRAGLGVSADFIGIDNFRRMRLALVLPCRSSALGVPRPRADEAGAHPPERPR